MLVRVLLLWLVLLNLATALWWWAQPAPAAGRAADAAEVAAAGVPPSTPGLALVREPMAAPQEDPSPCPQSDAAPQPDAAGVPPAATPDAPDASASVDCVPLR